MIELQNVTRSYGRKLAVDRLDLSVRAGEVFAFLGPNGAGKTTTIKMLVGLLRPSSGTIRLCGFDVVTEFREAARRLGYVPDEPYLYDKLTGREFLQPARHRAKVRNIGANKTGQRVKNHRAVAARDPGA